MKFKCTAMDLSMRKSRNERLSLGGRIQFFGYFEMAERNICMSMEAWTFIAAAETWKLKQKEWLKENDCPHSCLNFSCY